jgi:hypothetical protein
MGKNGFCIFVTIFFEGYTSEVKELLPLTGDKEGYILPTLGNFIPSSREKPQSVLMRIRTPVLTIQRQTLYQQEKSAYIFASLFDPTVSLEIYTARVAAV